MAEINVLITAASRRVPLIQAFAHGLRRLGVQGRVITTDMNTLSPGLYFSDKHYLVPLTTDKNYIPIIKSICFKERIHLLIPTIDDEVPIFGSHAASFLAMGVWVAVSSQETGSICTDKYKTASFLASKGIPTAKTMLPSELHGEELSYPLFIKPRVGRGSVGCHPIHNLRELEFFLYYVSDPVVQEFLPGREFTIDLLTDFDRNVISVVPRERLVIRSGVTDRGRTWNNPAMINLGVRVAKELGIRGPANLQIKFHEGKSTVFEVNPRFSGGIPLTIAAGADFPTWLIEMRLGKRMPPMIGEFLDGLVMACYESAIFLPEEARGSALPAPISTIENGLAEQSRARVKRGPWRDA